MWLWLWVHLNSFLYSAKAPRLAQGSCGDFALCESVRITQLTQAPESTNHYHQEAEPFFFFFILSCSPYPQGEGPASLSNNLYKHLHAK